MSREPVDALERRLFDAARSEQPTHAAAERALARALALPPSRRRGPLVAGVLAAAAIAALVGSQLSASREPRIGAEHWDGTDTAPARDSNAAGKSSAPPLPAPAPAPIPVSPAPSTSVRARGRPAASASASVVAPSLEQETAVLARAEEELRAGRPSAALALLDEYEHTMQRVRGANLAAEAQILRMQALSRAGRASDAAALAQSFVRNYPNSALVDRARGYLPASDASDASDAEAADAGAVEPVDAGTVDAGAVERMGGTR